MGYESCFYIVEKSNRIEKDNKRFAEIIALFNLTKTGERFLNKILPGAKVTDGYFYADNSSLRIDEDNYGEPLKEIELDNLIKALEYEIDNEKKLPFRRFAPFLAFLLVMKQYPQYWGNTTILHYGC